MPADERPRRRVEMPSVVVVDSSVWIDFFNGSPGTHVRALIGFMSEEVPLAVPDIVAMEVLQGFRSDRAFEAARHAFEKFDRVEIAGFDACMAAASRYRQLRAAGVTPRKSVDMLIGSWCIDHHAALLHNDRDFEPMVRVLGLRTIDLGSAKA